MTLALLTLSLLCVHPASAQSGYPGGGSGSGGSGSGYPGGPAPDHCWKITYSGSGINTYAIPNDPTLGQSTPQSEARDPTAYEVIWSSGGPGLINGSCAGSVTATLTWIPTAGKTIRSDPPAKTVSVVETGFAMQDPGHWNYFVYDGLDPPSVGSANNGLGDTSVAWGSGHTCSGSHRVKQDGSSGTITLGPFTLTAINPVSAWLTDDIGFPYFSYSFWNWTGGLCEVGFGVQVVPPAHPVNFRCTSASADFTGDLKYVYAWDSSTGNLADLDGCTIKERVSYADNVGGVHVKVEDTGQTFYIPPFPFAGKFVDPEIYGGTPGADGSLGDTHYVPMIPGSATIPGLYEYGAYNAAQEYIYTDDNSDPNNPNDYTVLRGPIDIDREVYAPSMNWIYRITKYDAPEGSSKPYAEATVVLRPIYPQFGP